MLAILPVMCGLLLFLSPNLSAGGHFEFQVHYSKWSLNIFKSQIESELGKALETNFKDAFIDEIHQDYPNMEETFYEQNVTFDSGGDNYGFEIRWYPGGYKGSFSLGLSVEKTSLMVGLPNISAQLDLQDLQTGDTASFAAAVNNAEFRLSALSFHLGFQLDIFPSWVIHPFMSFGAGAAFNDVLGNAQYSYSWTGDLIISGQQPENYGGSDTKTVQELKDELEAEGEEFPVPDLLFQVFPFVEFSIGLKAAFIRNLHFMVEAGFFNGFIIRGGVALRI